MPHCWIALGGNLGDVRATLERALKALDRPGVRPVQASRFYDTTPVGSAAEQRYLNAAAELDVTLAPEELLDVLQQIEVDHGRERSVHWGPRTLDLDLLLYEQTICDIPRLSLPHPGLWYRRFVLDPLAEIAAEVVHPVFGEPIWYLRSRLVERRLPIHLHSGNTNAVELRDRLDTLFGHHLIWVPAHMCPAIVLELDLLKGPVPADLQSRSIDLRNVTDPFITARDVLTAALDDPMPLD